MLSSDPDLTFGRFVRYCLVGVINTLIDGEIEAGGGASGVEGGAGERVPGEVHRGEGVAVAGGDDLAAGCRAASDAGLARNTAMPPRSSGTPQRPAGVRASTLS